MFEVKTEDQQLVDKGINNQNVPSAQNASRHYNDVTQTQIANVDKQVLGGIVSVAFYSISKRTDHTYSTSQPKQNNGKNQNQGKVYGKTFK